MERQSSSRRHYRGTKSTSALPPCTELDPKRRRSGIRHFSHVSLRHDEKPQLGKGKKKFRSVSAFTLGGMHLRNPFKNGNRYPTYDPGYQTVGAVREDHALQELQTIQEARDGMRVARRVPVRNQGYMMFPQDEAPLAPYPYPQHIPGAAAPQPEYHPQAIVPGGYLGPIPGEGPYRGVSMSFESMAKVFLTIGVIVGTLSIWIFWREILKSGLIFGGFASSCYLMRLGWHAVLKYRDDDLKMQGMLFPPQQPQHYIIQRPPQELGIPGGW